MFNSSSPFTPEEKIGRSIPQGFWDEHENRPSSSLFRNQTGGCSVDRQGDRNEQELINSLLISHKKSLGVAILRCKDIWDVGCIVISTPNEDNYFHCSLLESIDKTEDISRSKARQLAKICVSSMRN